MQMIKRKSSFYRNTESEDAIIMVGMLLSGAIIFDFFIIENKYADRAISGTVNYTF